MRKRRKRAMMKGHHGNEQGTIKRPEEHGNKENFKKKHNEKGPNLDR